MKNQQTTIKKVPLLAKVLTPVAKYFHQCTEETQRNIRNLGGVLTFTVLVCGFILAASIVKFGFEGNSLFFLPCFVISCAFYYILDKPMVFSDIRANGVFLKRFRVFVALVLALFNSFLIDSFFFNKDIVAARISEITKEQNEIRSKFSDQNLILSKGRETLMTRVNGQRDSLKAQRRRLDGEADGTLSVVGKGQGTIWGAKYSSYQADSIAAETEFVSAANEVVRLDSIISANNLLMLEQINQVPEKISKGINKSMELLHKVIFSEGKFTNIFLAILLLLISMLLELVPLISKRFYDVQEYFEKSQMQRSVKDKEATMVMNKELNLVGHKLVLETQSDKAKHMHFHHTSTLKDTIEFNKQMTNITSEELDRIQQEDERLRKKYPQYYETHVKPMIEESLKNLLNTSKSAYSS